MLHPLGMSPSTLMDLGSSTFCGPKVVHFKVLKTCPFHGLHEFFILFRVKPSTLWA